MAFVVLAFSQLIHSFSVHAGHESVFRNFGKINGLFMQPLLMV